MRDYPQTGHGGLQRFMCKWYGCLRLFRDVQNLFQVKKSFKWQYGAALETASGTIMSDSPWAGRVLQREDRLTSTVDLFALKMDLRDHVKERSQFLEYSEGRREGAPGSKVSPSCWGHEPVSSCLILMVFYVSPKASLRTGSARQHHLSRHPDEHFKAHFQILAAVLCYPTTLHFT